jgi:hypothetical protein
MNINSEESIESNEIYNETKNNSENNNNEIENNEEEELIDDEKLIDDEELINNNEKKICGFNKFKEEVNNLELGNLETDSFDRTSEYSYVSIPEINKEKNSIDYLYIISFLIGVFLIYYFYSGNIFITVIELILNAVFPYIYIVIKLFLIKGKLVEKIKGIENNK